MTGKALKEREDTKFVAMLAGLFPAWNKLSTHPSTTHSVTPTPLLENLRFLQGNSGVK